MAGFASQRSEKAGAVVAQGVSLAAVCNPGSIGRGPQVCKTTALVHDLNNLLSIVQANLQLLDRENSDRDQWTLIKDALEATELCDEVIQKFHGERSDPVTRRLPLDINEELALICSMIQKCCGSGIQVEYDLASNLGWTDADPSLLRNACFNLVANARDAMTARGQLVITTSNVEIEASSALSHIDATPGDYVMLSFRDTGPGIPPETLQRIFEPCFSTKTTGRSLGVGLTLVWEFCQRFEGFVRVDSRLGVGTTVSIYLPRRHDC